MRLPRPALRLALTALLGLAAVAQAQAQAQRATASPCPTPAERWAGQRAGRCLAVWGYGPTRAATLVVVLHGDVSGGGNATYHRALAQRIAEAMPNAAVVAMVRPGYPASAEITSDGDLNGRTDHYTADNMAIVAEAIASLRARTGAQRVVAVGHSGGAATAANILARHPGTIDAAVLVSCPCALNAWRVGRRSWGASVDPYAGIPQVPATVRVHAFTGEADDNTRTTLAADYVSRLAARGVAARFTPVPGAGHNDVVQAMWNHGFGEALIRLAAP